MNADNLVILNGRLVKDVDLRQNQNGDRYGLFTVAVNRNYKKSNGERPADFQNCVANGKQAEIIAQYFKKGDMIGIVGELRDNNYVKDGVQQYSKQIKVDSFGFRNSNNQNQSSQQQNNNYQANSVPSNQSNQNMGQGNRNYGQHNQYAGQEIYNDPFESNGNVVDINDDDLPF